MNDKKLAKQCLNFKNYNCDDKDCLNDYCPLNEKKFVKGYLAPDVVLSIMLKNSKHHDESIKLLEKEGFKCVLSDFALYEALAAINYNVDEFDVKSLYDLIIKSEFFDSHCYVNINDKRKLSIRQASGVSCDE